jgi:RNA polymerase sigma factor (sigma-70 family)
MPDQRLGFLLRLLRRHAGERCVAGLSDAALLERFLRQRDEAAFEALFWRHGPMVLAVCRRMLSPADAEDAFQATFLVLVRKAASIGRHEAVGAWLYRVAHRVALRARTLARPMMELPPEGPAAASDEEAVVWRDLRPVLDDAIDSLPEKYRAPVILCYLEGKTNQEAARELGCPRATVATRLRRARERLRQCLGRRGLLLPGAGLGVALVGRARADAVDSGLAHLTLKDALRGAGGGAIAGGASPQAVALADGVTRTMFPSKVKLAVLLLIAQGLIVGGGVWWHAQAVGAASPLPDPLPAARAAPDKDERDGLVDVASARDGILDYLGSEATLEPGERPPAGAFNREVTLLLAEPLPDAKEPKTGWIKIEGKSYRPVSKHEELRPGKVRIHHFEKLFVPLKVGMKVEPGQLLGMVDPSVAVDELSAKLARLNAAEAERVASEKVRDYYEARYRMLLNLGPTASKDEVNEARAGWERYKQDVVSKGEQVNVASRDLRQANTVLEQHQIRSRVRGVVTKVYRHAGEGVKALEPVLRVRLEDN